MSAGSTSGNSPLFDIMKSDKIRVFVDVPRAASSEIVNKMPAVAKSHVRGGREFQGAVSRTSEAIDPTVRTLKVEVDINNPELALKPGMYLDVSVRTSTANPPLEIPARSAEVPRRWSGGGGGGSGRGGAFQERNDFA